MENVERIELRLKDFSQAIVYENATAFYQKGSFACFYLNTGKVDKYPVSGVFDIKIFRTEEANSDKTMSVEITLKQNTKPVELKNAVSTNEFSDFYVINLDNGNSTLYPLADILTVSESYNAKPLSRG